MRLSEAIRLGATMKPQGKYYFFRDGATCAQGAALDAVGLLHEEDSLACHYEMARLWPWVNPLDPAAACFSCPFCGPGRGRMASLIAHLNNDHEWSRERIADFVKLHEPIPVPESVEEEQHV